MHVQTTHTQTQSKMHLASRRRGEGGDEQRADGPYVNFSGGKMESTQSAATILFGGAGAP